MPRPVSLCLCMLWPPVFGWACRALGEGDVRAVFDVGRAYTQNGRYNHKYHFFIGTTLNGGIWQSKFQCKTPTPSGQTGGCAKQTAARPHNERRGRTWYQVILGIVKILGTWTPPTIWRANEPRDARPLSEILVRQIARYQGTWLYGKSLPFRPKVPKCWNWSCRWVLCGKWC